MCCYRGACSQIIKDKLMQCLLLTLNRAHVAQVPVLFRMVCELAVETVTFIASVSIQCVMCMCHLLLLCLCFFFLLFFISIGIRLNLHTYDDVLEALHALEIKNSNVLFNIPEKN